MKPDTRINLSWMLYLLTVALLVLARSAFAGDPTLTTISPLPGAVEDQEFTINYNILKNSSNAADPENEAISFRIEAVSTGTLLKGNSAVVAGTTTLGNGESLLWTPAANASGTLNAFTVRALANGGLSALPAVQVRVIVIPVNDAPQISGSIVSAVNDNAASAFLAGLTVSDVEDDDVVLTVTVPKSADTVGSAELPGSTMTDQGNNHVYTFPASSIATANSRLDAASFNPERNVLAGGGSQSFSVTVTVRDSGNATLDNQTTGNVTVSGVDDPPAVELSLTKSSILPGVNESVFRVSINDPDPGDDEAKTVTLTLTPDVNKGTLTIPAGSLTGLKEQVEAGMATVVYRADPVTAATDVNFTCAVQGTTSTATERLSISFVNFPPNIAGIAAELLRTDDDTLTPAVVPFPSAVVSDGNAGQLLSATISLDNSAKGTVTVPAAGLSGITAAELTQRLRQVTFKPAANRVAVGQTEMTTLTVTVSDGIASVSNSLKQVSSLSVNGAPVVELPPGTVEPVKVAGETSGRPFTLVTIRDDDPVPTVTVTLKIDEPAKGTLSPLNAAGTFTSAGAGTFTFTGTDAAATAALAALTYTLNPAYPFPPGQPGLTTFTIEAKDSLQNRTTLVMTVVMQNAARNFLVTLREDDSRQRPGSLRHAVANAKDNDVITFDFPDYPAVLRLDPAAGPLVLTKHLRLAGPGADLLTISGDRNGDGTPDTQLFQVESAVVMEGLTLSHGTAPTGGAVLVTRNAAQPSAAAGSLTLRRCAVQESRALQWGGGIDVQEGSLVMEQCLLKNNATDSALGLGGGAVSLYSSAPCSFVSCTFSGNRQRAATGYGGGAVYAENFNPQTVFPVAVTHCTFAANDDAAARGTSVHSNVFNSRVTTRGSIFADGGQRNLYVAGGGQILSGGRNVSNDAAQTTLIQGGQPQAVVLLNSPSDKVMVDPALQPLAAGIGGMEAYAPGAGSPAIGTAAAIEAADQGGVRRDAAPDSGAIESGRSERVVINEVLTDPAAGGSAFVEIYVPRDSTPVNFTGMTLYVDGQKRHTFGARTVQPGFGVIVAETAMSGNGTPVEISNDPFWPSSLTDHQRSSFEIRSGAALTDPVLARASLVNVFANPSSVALNLSFPNNSLTLDPQFRGHAYVPHSTGTSGTAASPGADTSNTLFGSPNASPAALADNFVIHEDDLTTLAVLANDTDADGLDKLVLVDVSPSRSSAPPAAPAGDDAAALSALGSGLNLTPAESPLRATALWYDPRTAQNHLPVGVSAQDTFYYTIVDIGAGPVAAYSQAGAVTRITSPAHRLTTGTQISISGADTPVYNGTFSITRIDDDTFSIPFTAAAGQTVDPANKGKWVTTGTRQPTQRSENKVTVTVMGRNDAPLPAPDTVATSEEQILRIMGDPDLIAPAPVFDTDPLYPAPRAFAAGSLLSNDSDPDDDDQPFRQLHLVGVSQAKEVTGYAGSPGQSPVTVTVPEHGLVTGDRVLISGYGGQSGYNSYHLVTVLDADTFTIPIAYVDNHPRKGFAGVVTPEGRLQTTSVLGAAVTLEIRTSRAETNVIYNPRTSAAINRLSKNEPAVDSFFYVVEDTHGGQAFSRVTVNVTGVNDTPEPQNDPGSVSGLASLVTGGLTLRDVLAGAKVLYSIPAAAAGRGTVTLRSAEEDFVLTGVPRTDEDTPLNIPAAELLGNDADIDHLDTLRIVLAPGQDVSREGAAVSLAGGGATVVYNPAVSARLNALAREEKVMDTIVLDISDGTAAVTVVVAIEVSGRNDSPTALADTVTIPEDQLLTVAPPAGLLNDRDPDQDTHLPDNRKALIPAANVATTVYGTRLDASATPADGSITSFESVAGNAAVTKVNAPAHGLNTGEEIRMGGTALDLYNGQFPIVRLDDNAFTIPVPASSGAATAGAGTWQSLRSMVVYDPRGSVFTGAPAGTAFTLDGLAQGQTYNDTWTYTMFDGSMVFANDDIFRVQADSSSVVLDVFANDANHTGLTGSLTVVAVGTPSQRGTAVIGEGNAIVYTPETSFVGDEFFTYTIADGQGNTDTALVTVRVTIDQLNGNLQANRDAFTVAKGQSPLLSVLANDDLVPATGAVLSITRISTLPAAGGSAVIEGSGIRYTPAVSRPAYPYTETFSYEISGGGAARAVATVSVTVVNREGTLPLRADTVSVPAGSSNNPLNVLANDNILPGSGLDLIITAAGVASNGTVSISPDKKLLLFTPAAGFIGTSSFTYTAGDELGGTGTATVSVVVGGLTTNNDFFTVPSAAATPVTLDVLANDRVLGSPGAVSVKAMAPVVTPLGTLSVSAGAQSLTFTPVAGQTGERNFAYLITDGTGREAGGSVTVFVSGPGLLANSDFVTVQSGSQSNALNVLLNDAQIPDLGQPKTIAGIGTGGSAPNHGGTATVNAAGDRILYTPAENFTGEERFTYFVTNGDTTAIAQVVVRVSDGTLVASNDTFSVFKGSTDMRLEVLANDRVLPAGGQPLTITGIGIVQNAPGQQGTVTVTGDGSALHYTPNPAATVFPYTESFTYEISGGTASRAEATVVIEVLNRAGAREVETNDDAFTVLAGGQNIVLSVLENDDIRPAQAEGWIITDPGIPSQNGSVVIAGRTIAYTPRSGFVGSETFAYTVSDGLGGTGTATVTVKVGDISVSDDIFTVLSGSGTNALDVLANDGVFPDGFPDRTGLPGLSGFTLATVPPLNAAHGSAVVSGDSILYQPAAGFTGEDAFTYWVKDDSGITFPARVTVNVEPAGSDRDSAVMTIVVTGVNDLPVFENPSATATNDRTPVRPFPAATVSDVDNQRMERLTLKVSWPADRGTFAGAFSVVSPGVIQFSGTPPDATAALRGLIFTPTENRIPVGTTEETVFTLSIDDGFVSAPVVVNDNRTVVTPVNDRPVFSGPSLTSTDDKTPVHPFPNGLITDVDDLGLQRLTVRVSWPAGHGSFSGGFTAVSPGVIEFSGTPAAATAALRALLFTPAENRIPIGQTGETAFLITLDDGFYRPLVEATGNRTVVTPVNDPPGFSNAALTSTDDRTAIHPFAGGGLTDADNQGTHPLTVRISWPAGQGSLTGGFRVISPGVIEFVGQPAEATAALRGLLFTPVENRIPVGQTEETAFLVTLNDGIIGTPVTVTGNRTLVTPVNDLPQISGTTAGQRLYQMATLKPFVAVNISDVDNLNLQPLQVSVQIDDPAKGFLSSEGGLFVESPAGGGSYVFSGTPGAVSAAIRGLVFEPTPNGRITPAVSETAAFTITVTDNFGPPVSDATTTVVILHAETGILFPLNPEGQNASQAAAEFGSSTAISEDTLIIGSPRRDSPANDAGQVFVYERNAGADTPWGQVAALTAVDAKADDHFGEDVAIDGDVMVIGAPYAELSGATVNSGAAYVFLRNPENRNSWTSRKRLNPPLINNGGGDLFGSSVAIYGTTILVGSPRSSISGENNAGRVHVFERNAGGPDNWGYVETLTAGDGRSGDTFGNALAINGNTAVIGAVGASRTRNDAGWELGAAYLFDRPAPGGSWTQSRKIENFGDPESRPFDRFGFDVDIDRDTVIVGASRFDTVVAGVRRENGGAAFIFDRNTGGDGNWGLVTKLASPDSLAFDNYGWSVAIFEDLCLIGVPRENTTGILNGFMDVRRRQKGGPANWGIIDRLSPGDSTLIDRFGQSVALDQFTGTAGAIVDSLNAGSVRVYQFHYDQGPKQALNILDQLAVENRPFSFMAAAGTLGDPIYGAGLTFTAALADGSPLPPGGWLTFDPSSALFSGTPVPGNNAALKVVLTAENPMGTRFTSNVFSISVDMDPARNLQRAYADWAAGAFPAATLGNPALESTVWGALANPDADRTANLLEMLFGSRPLVTEPSPVTLTKLPGSQVSLTFPQSDFMPAEFIHVEWSGDLGTWSRQSVGYDYWTDGQGRNWITATVYPEAPKATVFVRIAVGP